LLNKCYILLVCIDGGLVLGLKQLNVREIKALFILSIVIPVSLLATFRLTGILTEPKGPIVISETTTLEPVKWEFKRLDGVVNIREKIESFYNANVLINQSVFISRYESRFGIPYGDNVSVVILTTNITATITDGFIESVYIVFREDYEPSEVNIWNPELESNLHVFSNLSIENWADKRSENSWMLSNSTKAFILLNGVNHPNRVHYWTVLDWVLRSPLGQFHQFEIVYEVTYFDGRLYKKTAQPFLLSIIPPEEGVQ